METHIINAMHRIEELYHETNGQCYVSFSGGKDSTILLALIKMCEEVYTIPQGGIKAVFVNTGVELGATLDFVKWCKTSGWYENIEVIYPEKSFHWCLTEKGKPMKSKMKSEMLKRFKKNEKDGVVRLAKYYLLGKDPNGKKYSKTRIGSKDLHLLNPNFDIKISNSCCEILKKKPALKFTKENNMKGYMLGERNEEGGARQLANEKRVENGGKACTRFKGEYIVKLPIVDWTENDVDNFISDYKVPQSDAYTKYGLKRTGCMGCPYSLDIAFNLEALYKYEPLRYKASMHWLKDVYIAQNIKLPFDEDYENDRINTWDTKYSDMRYEMLEKYRSDIAFKYKNADKKEITIFDFI